MALRYVFTDGNRTAVTYRLDAGNLPNLGRGVGVEWQAVRRMDDAADPYPAGFSAAVIASAGFQVLP
ncbi:hypothetical protein [Bradyrhizobium sp. CB2312]|uniref:hypothetical protein n=1 Tax=Bradyrhizobium sp. CB2312 TaxID=3039155 RepID=UPI0024B08958|nr:hypothetical protein [Bradyrhizobium sp. CB2312]WFU68591.1 hypothetical protein QA642_25015 [Bradyrhizobium sp. CB2312]